MRDECNCPKCKQLRIKSCDTGFPKLVWFSEYTFFTIGVLVRDEIEFNQCVDSLVYMSTLKK